MSSAVAELLLALKVQMDSSLLLPPFLSLRRLGWGTVKACWECNDAGSSINFYKGVLQEV